MKNPEFLQKKYGLHNAPEVERAAQRKGRRTGEKVSQAPEVRIQNYLDRLGNIFNPPERDNGRVDRKERNLSLMKNFMHNNLIVKPGIATDEYLKYDQRLARERGHGDVKVPDETKNKITSAVETVASGADIRHQLQGFSNKEKQMAEEIIARMDEQTRSLDKWVDYLASDDALYPDWLKYWAMRSVIGLSSYDKDEKRFPIRNERTTNPFPDLNQQALSAVLDAVEKDDAYKQKVKSTRAAEKSAEKKYNKKRQQAIAQKIAEMKSHDPDATIDRQRIMDEIEMAPFDTSAYETELPADERDVEPAYQEMLDTTDFATLYAHELEKLASIDESKLANTTGQWVKYNQGSDHMVLAKALQPYNTTWCTAGEETARYQLSRGDFYVYYSQDDAGENTLPRAAIRMEGDAIAEVRGIAQDQNTDPYINPIVKEKVREFPNGEKYLKKSDDMNRVSKIYDKTLKKDPQTKKITILSTDLTKDELQFLYEIDSAIDGFGYPDSDGSCSDPRIKELRAARDAEQDMPIIFECKPEQIARATKDITQGTKAYVGTLESGVFDRIQEYNIQHVYTQFPERKIRRISVEIGGKNADELLKKMEEKRINVANWAKHMIKQRDFMQTKQKETADLVRLSVADLLPYTPTTDQLNDRAQEMGLELCPAEVGLRYRLQYMDQPQNDSVHIGMKQIAAPGGDPFVFILYHNDTGLWLNEDWARPSDKWRPSDEFLFRLRKSIDT